MKVLILSVQSTGASLFACFLGQGERTVALVNCGMQTVPEAVPPNVEHMVIKQTLHPKDIVTIEDRIATFKPDRVLVFVRHPADIWNSLQSKNYCDFGGSPEEKLLLLDKLVASEKHVVLRFEDFVGNQNLFLLALRGCLPGMDLPEKYYDLQRQIKSMLEFNTAAGFKWFLDYSTGGIRGGKIEDARPKPVPKDVMSWIGRNCPNLMRLYAKDQRTLVAANPRRKKFTFHYVAAVHVPVVTEYSACAYTQKIHKLTRMLLKKGHKVILYGVGRTDLSHPNLEFVPLLTMAEVRAEWGDKDCKDSNNELGYDWRKECFRHDMNSARTKTTEKFLEKAIEEIHRRGADDHFLLLPLGGYQKAISDALKMPLTVEPGVGYTGVMGPFIAYESAFLRNWVSGKTTKGDVPDGRSHDRVIPNYYDPEDFPFISKPENYFVFMGRIIERKGFKTAYQIARTFGVPIKIIGQGNLPAEIKNDPLVTYITAVGPKERGELLGKAAVAFVPTIYMEPFGGVSVEAMLCGTPVITTDFGVFPETVQNGVNGYRCNSFDEFVSRTADAVKLDRAKVRDFAMRRFSMDAVNEQYEEWWRMLYDWYLGNIGMGGGWWGVTQQARWKISQVREHFWRGQKNNVKAALDHHPEYLEKMGILGDYPNLDLGGKRVLDVGGGSTSLLRDCKNVVGAVLDPGLSMDVPNPYEGTNIKVIDCACEEMTEEGWDEVWVCNLLRHVNDPVEAAKRILRAGKVIRVWEPILPVVDKQSLFGLTPSDYRLLYGNAGSVVPISWRDGDSAYVATIRKE